MVRFAGAMLCKLEEEQELPFDKTALFVFDISLLGLSFILCTDGCVFSRIEEEVERDKSFCGLTIAKYSKI